MVEVIADATALHAPPILHEVALCAVNTPVSTCPSTGGAEAVTGLTVQAIEVPAIFTGDGTPGALQAQSTPTFRAAVGFRTDLAVFTAFPAKIFFGVLIRSIRAVSHTAIGFFIQEVSIFTGQALVTVAPKAGLTVRGTLSASLLVSMVVARGAGGDTDPGIVFQLVVVVQTVIAVVWSRPFTADLTALGVAGTCVILCTIVIGGVFDSAIADTFHFRKLVGW